MKLLNRWAIVAAVLSVPYAVVMLVGWWWLFERGYLVWWAVSALALFILGRMLADWASRPRDGRPPGDSQSPNGGAPWEERARKKVEIISSRAQSESWALEDPQHWQELLQQVLDAVARERFPESNNPLLDIQVPQIAKLVELVARDLGAAALENIPGIHLLTINDLLALREFSRRGQWLWSVGYPVYRVARLLTAPGSGLLREVADRVSGNIVDKTLDHARRRLLDIAIRKTGHYAIELYSGRLMVAESYVTSKSAADAQQAKTHESELAAEPLRILVIGQTKAGKSSLVNALFGQVKSAVDVLPTTRDVTPFVVEREGLPQALIFDTAGYAAADSSARPFAEIEAHLLACDLVLVVCSATSAAREPDRTLLDQLRGRFQTMLVRQPPPVVVVLTHIDQLRPLAEWSPPYDLSQPTNDKARRIAEAARAVAADLRVPTEHVIPVCLHAERLYNVEEGLIPAVMAFLPAASRAKALRLVIARRDEEYWNQLWRQAVSTGRLVVENVAAAIGR